jgi:phage terminase large subunit GpA-like protein
MAHAASKNNTVSFTISFLYAPLGWDSWLTLAQEYLTAQHEQEAGDSEKMQVFWNTRLARCWSAVSTRIGPAELMAKAEHYPVGIAPARALVVTGTVDVQGFRLEAQIVGWGPGPTGLEAWVISTHVLLGDPTLPEVWRDLDALLMTPIRHATGAIMPIAAVGIDSGDGDSASEVYEFVRPRKRRFVAGQMQRVLAIKGASQARKPIIAGKPSKIEYNYRGRQMPGGVELWMIGTDTAKDWVFNRLALEHQIAIHTPAEFPLGFYEQVLSEAKITRWVGGRKRQRYELLKKGLRNEQLDMLQYNLAMAHYLGLHTHTAERWKRIEATLRQADLLTEIAPEPERALPATPALAAPIPAPALPSSPRFYIPA